MRDPNADPDLFVFPELPDDAVVAVNDFLEEFYTRFQNRYFAQMHRYDYSRPDPDRYNRQIALPLDPAHCFTKNVTGLSRCLT